jgi:DNA-binding NarL/FixJ family response regulator
MMIADLAVFEFGRAVDVRVVTSGREAASVLEAEGASAPPLDVVICDLSMPGVDGVTLYEGLVARHSPLARRFVLVTGGAFTPAAADAIARHALPCLQKPFSSETLAATLRPYLAGG